jgi:hypothetical protein
MATIPVPESLFFMASGDLSESGRTRYQQPPSPRWA